MGGSGTNLYIYEDKFAKNKPDAKKERKRIFLGVSELVITILNCDEDDDNEPVDNDDEGEDEDQD